MAERVSRVEAKRQHGEPIIVIIYCRVSTEDQEENTSLKTQEEACTDWCKEMGYIAIDVVKEVYSGYEYEQRKKLQDTFKKCRRGDADAIVYTYHDRLSRNDAHRTLIEYDAEKYGYSLLCVKEPYNNDDLGEKIKRKIYSVFAEMEREKIRIRTVAGRKERAREGKLLNGAKPRYGYRYADEKHSHYVIYEPEAHIVRRIDDLYLQGYSQAKIARMLTDEGIPTPTGNSIWNHTSVSVILNCTEYHGVGYRYRSKKDDDGHILLPPDVFPQLRTLETYNKIQTRLATSHSTSLTSNIPDEVLLRGIIRCGVCGRAMILRYVHANGPNGKKYGYLLYLCQQPVNATHTNKHFLQIRASTIEKAVTEYVNDVLADLEMLLQVLKAYIVNHSSEGSIEAYNRAIADLRASQEELSRDLLQVRGNGRNILLARINELETEIEKIEEHKRQVTDGGGWKWEYIKAGISEVIEWLEAGCVDFDTAPFDLKRKVLRVLGIVVEVHNSKKKNKHDENDYSIKVTLPTLDNTSLRIAI